MGFPVAALRQQAVTRLDTTQPHYLVSGDAYLSTAEVPKQSLRQADSSSIGSSSDSSNIAFTQQQSYCVHLTVALNHRMKCGGGLLRTDCLDGILRRPCGRSWRHPAWAKETPHGLRQSSLFTLSLLSPARDIVPAHETLLLSMHA